MGFSGPIRFYLDPLFSCNSTNLASAKKLPPLLNTSF